MKKQVRKQKVSRKPAKNGSSIQAVIPELSKQPSIQQVLKLALEISNKVNSLTERVDALVAPTKTVAKKQKPEKQQVTSTSEDVDRVAAVEKLIGLLDAKTLKVADIAKFVGIASSSVSCWLHGVSLPAQRHMDKVSKLLAKY